ncbi:TylF/MycF/NovP-related O-methyltransferase [Nocardia gipuzkoensis]
MSNSDSLTTVPVLGSWELRRRPAVPAVARAIQRCAAEKGLSASELSRSAGVSKRAIRRLAAGRVRALDEPELVAVARVLGFDHQQAMGTAHWRQDSGFLELYNEVSEHTLLSPHHLFSLWQLARATNSIPGSVAEVGVFRGGSARLLARSCSQRRVFLFDTFEGIPYHKSVDIHRTGDFRNTSLREVSDLMLDCPNSVIRPGIFPHSACDAREEVFSLVHIDVDVHEAVEACLKFFYDRLHPGGVLVLDDYGYWSCPGVQLAVRDFFADRPEAPIVTAPYQAAIFKL